MNKKFIALSMLMFASWSSNVVSMNMAPLATRSQKAVPIKDYDTSGSRAEQAPSFKENAAAGAKYLASFSGMKDRGIVDSIFGTKPPRADAKRVNNNDEIPLAEVVTESPVDLALSGSGIEIAQAVDLPELTQQYKAMSDSNMTKQYKQEQTNTNNLRRPADPKIDRERRRPYQDFLNSLTYADLASNLINVQSNRGYQSRSQVATDIANKMLLDLRVPESVLTSPRFLNRQFNAIKEKFSQNVGAAAQESNQATRLSKISDAMSNLWSDISSYVGSFFRSQAAAEVASQISSKKSNKDAEETGIEMVRYRNKSEAAQRPITQNMLQQIDESA